LNLSAATFTDANWISMGGIPGANGTVSAAIVDGSGNLYVGAASQSSVMLLPITSPNGMGAVGARWARE